MHWVRLFGDAQSVADTTTGATAIGAVLALIGMFITFMKLTSGSTARVDTITAAQIKQLGDLKTEAEKRADDAEERQAASEKEAESWRQRYETERDRTTELRITLARLEGGTGKNAGSS